MDLRTASTVIRIPLLVAVSVAPAAGQDIPGSQDPIAALERGLLPANVLADRPLPRWSLEERMRAYGVPGVSVAVIDGGRLAWARGWGVKRAGGDEPVDTATLFQAASISKPVAALGVLILVQDGTLSLDEDVSARLRSWTIPPAVETEREKITLRRLLSHTAGLTVHGFRGYARGEAVPTVVQVLDGTEPANSAAVRSDAVPGSLWRYSGGGTTVAQLLVTDVTGLPFDAFMRAAVLDPLQLRHSTFTQPLPARRAHEAAVGHRADGSPVEGDWHTYPEQAAAGLWTTPSDLARIALEVQGAHRGESERVITRETAREMLTEVDGGYGLGFGVGEQGGEPTFSHGGSNEGYRATFVAWRDRGQGVFVMTNSDTGAGLAGEIVRGVADVHGWSGPEPRVRTTRSVASEERARYVGRWVVGGRSIEIVASETGLTVAIPGFGEREYLPDVEGRWFALGGGPELEFVEQGGRLETMLIHGVAPEPVRAERADEGGSGEV